jgi:simple sugar transport system ATP-binding protein
MFLNRSLIEQYSQELISQYNILTPNLRTPAKLLSGGNIQKLILAREISGNPTIILAAHPTYGLDVGATEQIRQLLLNQRDRGAAVLLVSEDLDEILSLSDRIVVMYEGKIIGEMDSENADIKKIGLMMAGIEQ